MRPPELLPGEKVDFGRKERRSRKRAPPDPFDFMMADAPKTYTEPIGSSTPIEELPRAFYCAAKKVEQPEVQPKQEVEMADEKPKRVMSEEQKAKIRATMLARNRKKNRAAKKKAPAPAKAAPVLASGSEGSLRKDVARLVIKYGFDAVYETAKTIEKQALEGGN